MANHVRQQLREAVGAAVSGLPTTGGRVFQSRVYPLEQAELPGLCVFTTSEEAQDTTIHSPLYQRTVSITVAGYAAASANVDDTLDMIAKEVEMALAGLTTVNGGAVNLSYAGTDIDFQPGDRPHGTISLNYTAQLFTNAAAPDVLL